jgi:hypothetical protein
MKLNVHQLEVANALRELQDDFKAQLEYIENVLDKKNVEENLDYLIRDNSDVRHDNIMYARRQPCQVLQNWLDEFEGDSQ